MTLIKQRLDIEPILTPGNKGQFDVKAGNETVVSRGGNWLTRRFGAGYPELESVVAMLEKRVEGPASG